MSMIERAGSLGAALRSAAALCVLGTLMAVSATPVHAKQPGSAASPSAPSTAPQSTATAATQSKPASTAAAQPDTPAGKTSAGAADASSPAGADVSSSTAAGAAGAPGAESESGAATDFKTLDQDVQGLKKDVLDLNRDLFVLEEDLLFPANTQVAIFVSMDVGTFFGLDSVTLKVDNKDVSNYLYTEREAQALLKGGVQRLYIGNLKVGSHELVALFTGKGPHERDYRRGATLNFSKGVGAKYIELKISDKAVREQPAFEIKEWE